MRKQIKNVCECLHILLIFSIILPAIYMLGMERERDIIFRLYGLGYFLLPFILMIKRAAKSCQKLVCYFAGCILILCGAVLFAWGIGNVFLPQSTRFGYMLFMALGMLTITLETYSVRMHQIRRQKAKEEMDSTWRQKDYTLDKPHLYVCLWFALIYVVALNFACPEVCNLAVINLMLYLLMVVSYQFIEKTEEYLSINDEVCKVQNIPYKRIFGIGKYFVLSFLLLILLAWIPTILTVPYREYRDIRKWVWEWEVSYEELLQVEETHGYGEDPMVAMMASMGEIKELPFWVDWIFYALVFAIFAAILVGAIMWIHNEMRDFARGIDEAGDVVETLIVGDEEIFSVRKQRFGVKTEEERIRREYRRFIRKHRKDRPAANETPKEMESIAGVAETSEGIALHEKYEYVRYGEKSNENYVGRR